MRLSVVAVLFALAGCADHDIAHPPTFKQVERFYAPVRGKKLEECIDFYAGAPFQEFSKKFNFDKVDIEKLAATKNPDFLLAAGINQTAVLWRDPETMEEAQRLEPDDPEILIALFFAYQEGLRFSTSGVSATMLTDVVEKLKTCDPENSLADYLEAHVKLIEHDTDGMISAVMNGSKKPFFSFRTQEIATSIVRAAEHVGYSPFAARMAAMLSNTVVFSPIHGVARAICERPDATDDELTAVLDMGKKIESQSIFLTEKLVGHWLQRIVLTKMSSDDARSQLARVERRQAYYLAIRDLSDSDGLSYSDVSEERLVRYYDEMFGVSETAAIANLARERGLAIPECDDTP